MARRFAISSVAWFALACAAPTTEPEPWTAISGIIVDRDVPMSFAHGRPTVHVKEPSGDECGVIFAIAPETALRRRLPDGSLEDADVGDLRVGEFVHVWSPHNVVMLSCPGQAGADSITIVSG